MKQLFYLLSPVSLCLSPSPPFLLLPLSRPLLRRHPPGIVHTSTASSMKWLNSPLNGMMAKVNSLGLKINAVAAAAQTDGGAASPIKAVKGSLPTLLLATSSKPPPPPPSTVSFNPLAWLAIPHWNSWAGSGGCRTGGNQRDYKRQRTIFPRGWRLSTQIRPYFACKICCRQATSKKKTSKLAFCYHCCYIFVKKSK
jgi:hypothetical protein